MYTVKISFQDKADVLVIQCSDREDAETVFTTVQDNMGTNQNLVFHSTNQDVSVNASKIVWVTREK